jgi:D-sedoheptulose 7-phosphate isomerase
MALLERIQDHFQENHTVTQLARERLGGLVAAAGQQIVSALMGDQKVLVCGNGGAAALAQVFVSFLLGRFEKERLELASIDLTANTALLTAISNDFDYDLVFSKQIRGLGRPGDVLVVLCPTGGAANVVEAIHAAHDRQMSVIALTGVGGGKVGEMLLGEDLLLDIPSERVARIEELQLLLLHAMVDAVDFILLEGG